MNASQYNGQFHRASEAAPGVLLLEFNRPPVNAFHDPKWQELRQIIERASKSGEVRVIVLSSALERFFSAGLDLDNTGNISGGPVYADPARRALALYDHILEFQGAISSLQKARPPVIGAFYGYSLGLAVDIASACDIRLAAEDVKFGIMEVKVGLAADIGTLQRFTKATGNESKSRELALTGRQFGAQEAKDIGFVSDVVPGSRKEVIGERLFGPSSDAVIAAAIKLATVIAANSPVAVVSTKHIMNHARDHTVEESLEYQAAWNMAMLQSEDTVQSMLAVRAKRTPVYKAINATVDPKAKL
ncbi:Delta(3,5)-Delta(2,4)-dienoyl-CoA isomerase, mitochondrial [Vanrija pseudolonga]|uniref:Delta(3,5)-Delta(2,4)-dienoyl-CoA isomerase, mitochondrial n=1 Tax=Vanrija pseudolonga TaxID=143232 RepID=A0AAF0Y5X2_9TREE|nr:Delta(3,5)-Delta(2,4)-dienoyl-CoA isomerase, mitochondrial [Vanrija pseudolonga]